MVFISAKRSVPSVNRYRCLHFTSRHVFFFEKNFDLLVVHLFVDLIFLTGEGCTT